MLVLCHVWPCMDAYIYSIYTVCWGSNVKRISETPWGDAAVALQELMRIEYIHLNINLSSSPCIMHTSLCGLCISLPQFTGHFNSFSSPFYFHLQLFSVFEVSSVIMEIHIFLSLCTRNILRRRRRRISVVSQVEELQTETTSKWITTKGAKKNKPDHLFAALQPSCVGVLMMTIQPELKII